MFKKKKKHAVDEMRKLDEVFFKLNPKKKFNIGNYPGMYVMYCENKEELFKFYNYLHKVGRKLSTGRDYVELKATIDAAGRPIKYIFFNEGMHASYMDKAYASKYTVLNFKDFDWSDSNMERKTKFKVGDKVRVVKARIPNKEGYIGLEFDIVRVNPNCLAPCNEEHYDICASCSYVFFVDELELVKAAPFTKADLKPGMVVEVRDGARYLFVNEIFISSGGYLQFISYNDDLTHAAYDCLDVVKIFDTRGTEFGNILHDHHIDLIWERKEVKEMTVKEIEEQLGHKIKIIDGE